ncbi:MAG: M56 family metallopeptidase, partial [Verrucomicrobiota bacterium]
MGHWRRRDLISQQALLLAQAVHWFNPLVWILSRRTQLAAEHATDKWVLAKMGDRSSQAYGNALLNLLQIQPTRRTHKALAIGVAESKRDLKRRIAAIARFRRKSHKMVGIACGASLLLCAAITMSKAPEPDPEVAEQLFPVKFTAVDTSGQPVANADVKIYGLTFLDKATLILQSSCDESGVFSEPDLKSNQSILIVVTEPKKNLVGSITWNRDPETQSFAGGIDFGADLMLAPAEELKFRLLNEDSDPVVALNTLVVAFYRLKDENQNMGFFMSPASTDDEGRSHLLVPKGSQFDISHSRLDLTKIDISMRDRATVGDQEEFTYQLNPAHQIEGRITLPDGTPIGGAYLTNGFGDSRSISAISDANGYYRVGHLIPGVSHIFSINCPLSDENW